ncbi:type II toxin-antitoxin system HicB family antitoxin [Brevundimonas sp.]|uniref:type II toxin-antitoxin system HicB family antitoxin n=1 Tax=Brevundimonas sp. TaxID=1871086 RepID=UPI0027377F96|nr:type II toxin-antitoxin system HicB family antitoxin [Brevundimonas sp.]MDP3802500.1 type II toxin-antitoxin system HicB family antitoxin [Brevundimonas sp.]
MSTVIYVAIVEGDQDGGYSAFFPDLPGCVTGAESMLELPASAREALSLHLQGMSEDGEAFPEPTALEDIKGDPDVKEVGRILVDADVEDAPVRVNISIGAQFLKRVDVAAEARGMTRSGFLIEGARHIMALADDGNRLRSSPCVTWHLSRQRAKEKQEFWRSHLMPAPESRGTSTEAGRYMIVPAESADLAVVWDRLENQVIDIIECKASLNYPLKPPVFKIGGVASDPLAVAASGGMPGWTSFGKTG